MIFVIRTVFIVLFYSLISAVTANSQETSTWPCFHGQDRSNKSTETGLLNQWPEDGPGLLWSVSGLGEGYSTVSVDKGLIYTAGMNNKQTMVYAFNLEGEIQWQQSNGTAWETTKSWASSYTGARSTPTVDNSVIYHLGETGRLVSLAAKTGEPIWSMELRERFDAEEPEYGYSESVLIDGENLYCSPAGKKGFLVCLNKKTGDLIWTNTDISGSVGFSSHIIADYGGYHQIIGMSSNSVYGVDAVKGDLLWTFPYENKRSLNIPDPIFYQGHVFITSGYGKGSALIKLKLSENKIIPEIIWQTPIMDNHHGGVVLLNGYLYGSGDEKRGWYCLDIMTGEPQWKAAGKGSLTYAENMLYCLEEKGTMRLIKASAQSFEEVSAFEVPEGGKGMYWAHPVVCGGRLYIRHTDKLFAYSIKD